MRIARRTAFKKAYKKRILPNAQLHKRAEERILLFQMNPKNPILRDHQLIGTKKGLRAFSITGDIRVVYEQIDSDTVLLIDIGSHNQVY